MFPSNQYIPYKLREINLSFNSIPVVTFDITFGTKKLKKLDLSNNLISDVRSHVVGNLTNLEVLNLSHNRIRSLISSYTNISIELPVNLTELNLSDNNLEVLPVEKFYNATSLRILNLKNNKLSMFPPKLVKKIKKDNLEVYFEGNNLKCDCFARPLVHFLKSLKESERVNDIKYNNLICNEPAGLIDENLINVDEDRLICAGNIEVDNKMAELGNDEDEIVYDFVNEPDLVFRDVQ